MVMYAKEHQEQQEVVRDVVCPKCFKDISEPAVVLSRPERYGTKLRTYFGWCLDCQLGFEVIQFLQDKKWFIHKYRYYAAALDKPIPSKQWQLVKNLPDAPVVVIGPGGDYDKHININAECFQLLKALQKALKSTSELLGYLLKAKK